MAQSNEIHLATMSGGYDICTDTVDNGDSMPRYIETMVFNTQGKALDDFTKRVYNVDEATAYIIALGNHLAAEIRARHYSGVASGEQIY